MRIRRFESGPVLSLFDNSAVTTSAHDVSAAGTDWQDASWSALPGRKSGFDTRSRALVFRTWESLAFRVPRAHEIAGSNPAVLT